MPEYLSPSVYVEENAESGNRPIEGVSTSTAGFVGVTERGPVNVPILITSYGEYTRWFGGRLNVLDFRAPSGPACYLPHAVEGFFSNLGKRVYVCRIASPVAARAATMLFDRGDAADPGTQLIRAAGEASGTSATPPAIYLLNRSAIAAGAWFRIGEGSNADYVLSDNVTAAPADNLIPLGLPLARFHDPAQLAQELTRTVLLNFTLAAATTLGATIVIVTGTPADIAALHADANGTGALLEIGVANQGELRYANRSVLNNPTQATLTLDTGLKGSYTTGAVVAQLDDTTLVAGTAPLSSPADAGTPLVFIDGLALAANDLVVINGADATNREVRRVGTLGSLTLSSGVYDSYPRGSVVRNVSFSMPRVLTPGTSSITFDDVSAFRVGMSVVIEPTAQETVQITNITASATATNPNAVTLDITPALANAYAVGSPVYVENALPGNITLLQTITTAQIQVSDGTGLAIGNNVILGRQQVLIQAVTPAPTAANPNAGTITFTPALVNPVVAGDTVAVAPTTLSKDAKAGSSRIALATRAGLNVGDILRIGGEVVTIDALPSAGGPLPDAGVVLIEQELVNHHAAGDAVQLLGRIAPQTANIAPTVLALAGNQSAPTTLVVSDNAIFTTPGAIQVTTPAGSTYFHEFTATAAITAGGASGYGQTFILPISPLSHAHASGDVAFERDPMLQVQALDVGAWGNRLRIAVQDERRGLVAATTLSFITDPTHVTLASVAGVEAGTVLQLYQAGDPSAVIDNPVKVRSVNRSALTLVLDTPLSAAQLTAGAGMGVRSLEFSLTVYLLRQPDPAIPSRNLMVLDAEVFRNLSMDPRHSRYVQTIIGDINGLPLRLEDNRPEGQSWYIRVHDTAQDLVGAARDAALSSVRLGPEPLVDPLPDGGARPAQLALHFGDDGIATLTDNDYIGLDNDNPANRTGLFTLMNVEEVSIIAAPGRTSPAIQGALITQCEAMQYRFAVLDGPRPPNDSLNDVMAQRQQFDTKYAALYYPWLLINDPFPQNLDDVALYPVPPSGHVVGIYARTDEERGVHKAPANEVVNGVVGLQRTLYKPQHDILNPYPVNINVIRDFRQFERGIVVYGARVITSDSDWKYVNVRRLTIFIEASIYNGLQWVVFEPNDAPLWARVRRSISNFLNQVWRSGGLAGENASDAFFVKCDRTTMTQTDIETGRLIILVGIAPVMPAEFVIVRIGLMTAESETELEIVHGNRNTQGPVSVVQF